jgi:hypothetical protein
MCHGILSALISFFENISYQFVFVGAHKPSDAANCFYKMEAVDL